MRNTAIGLTACCVLLSGCITFSAGDRAVIRAKNKVAPALVHIRPVKEVFAGGKREEILVTGSGFIISPDGYVVTNEHVAGESKYVRCVLSDQREVEAEVVGTDRYTDIAVLKLVTSGGRLPTARLGSSRELRSGQKVLALGSPHGLARSVSMGIVSVTDRYLPSHGEMVSPYNNWIQTDAAINQGNSGGPLVNLKGEVVGVNARRLGGADNIGFAIPIDDAREVVEEIIAMGRVQRSWIGAQFEEMTRKTADPSQRGVIISDIDPLSPAFEAGLRPGDILLSVNDRATDARFVEALPTVRRLIADLPVDAPAHLRIARGKEELELEVTTVEKSDLRGNEIELSEWGCTIAEITPAVARVAQLQSRQGVLVSGVQPGGIAAYANLRNGDIILKMDNEEVTDLAAFKRMYDERVQDRKPLILLDVKRGALTPYVLLKQAPEDTAGSIVDTLGAEEGGLGNVE